MIEEIPSTPGYRKVVADLHACEERYQGLVDSISLSNDAQLESAVAALKSEVRQRRSLEAELLTAVEAERQRIGQDLHDDLCQQLGATAMMTSILAKRIAPKDKKSARELAEIPKLINATIESCRDIARGLHPITLHSKGLPAALEELADRIPRGIKFRWPTGKKIALEPSVALHLYRITEEAVGNAIKHSGAKNITVKLDVVGRETVLVVTDDGKGFEEKLVKRGMGLRNMEYRAHAVGAELTVKGRKEGGTHVHCRLPKPKAKVR